MRNKEGKKKDFKFLKTNFRDICYLSSPLILPNDLLNIPSLFSHIYLIFFEKDILTSTLCERSLVHVKRTVKYS